MAKKAKVLSPAGRNEEDPKTKKLAQRPQLKIVRNNVGTLVIILFGLFTDLVIFFIPLIALVTKFTASFFTLFAVRSSVQFLLRLQI